MATTELYGTDIGPACKCGGTVYYYYPCGDGEVLSVCVTCHKARSLFLDARLDLDARTIREHHVRANAVGV